MPIGRSAFGRIMASSALAGAGLGLPLVLVGCSGGGDTPDSRITRSDRYGTASPRLFADDRPIPKGGGVFKIGSPYSVAGRWYVPREDRGYDRSGLASWYGADFHGRKTANGEVYDMRALSAAHPTLPLPSYVYVTNLANGRTILVRVNDRGPYVADRLIDLSRRAAELLGTSERGVAQVRVRFAGYAPLDGNDVREHQFLAGQPWARGYALAGQGQAPALLAASSPPPSPSPPPYRGPDSAAPLPSARTTPEESWSFATYRAQGARRNSLGGPVAGGQ